MIPNELQLHFSTEQQTHESVDIEKLDSSRQGFVAITYFTKRDIFFQV